MKKPDLKINFKAITPAQKKMLLIELIVAVAAIAADWISKLAAFAVLKNHPDGITVIKDFFLLFADKNDGVAFSMFSGYSRLFGVFSVLVSAAIVWYLLKYPGEHRLMRNGFLLIFCGGIANGIERLIYGYVRDFICFTFYSNFNIADAEVVVGAILVAVYLIFFSSKDLKNKEAARLKQERQADTAKEPQVGEKNIQE
ncbi:MAG: signal peptidase II [Clostridiales bacterium]|jgi:signal peptidase II|nr:signal peptidase II [Clostridiales bacterium]